MNERAKNVPMGSKGRTPALPKRVFIAGANGFIGRALMTRYQSMCVQVRGMDLIADEARDVM